MIYLDSSATTKPYPEVIETFSAVATKYFANPSSIHQLGGEVERLISQSRNRVADLLHVQSGEIIFTSGGTEGNNLAIKGTALQLQTRGKHLITTAVEHASTYEAFKQLESLGFEVTFIGVDPNGLIALEELKQAIRPDTTLVSIIHVNNETGAVQPIPEIGRLLKDHPKIIFHVDHVQGIGKVPLDFKKAHIDLCTLSGHKFHALKGTGILYIREGVRLAPLFTGGTQENKFRAGTENVPGIVAMVKALRMMLEHSKHGGIEHLVTLKQKLMTSLSKIDGVEINTPPKNSAPHIVHFSIPGIKPEVLIHSLGKKNIYVSTKSACSSKQTEPSRVLLACGFDEKRANSGIRISLSFENTEEEIDFLLDALKEMIPTLKQVMGL